MKRGPRPLLLLTILVGCNPAGDAPASGSAPVDEELAGVMEVRARGLSLEAPTRIPSGWTTIRFDNASDMTHFVVVERLPDGQGAASHQEEVAPVFQAGMDLLARGEVDAAVERFGDLPPWFGEIVFLGGPGLTAAGRVSEATVHLEPGTYLLECYVKTNGIFHSHNPDPSMHGMVHEFTVTAEATDLPEPEATVTIDISSTDGIQVQGVPRAGEQTVAVRFGDQVVHENFVGHDVHVVQLSGNADLSVLESWMNWTSPDGLQTPAPAQFVGGLNEMPSGTTGYFTLALEPGRYAWVAEVPGTIEKRMLQEFTVQ